MSQALLDHANSMSSALGDISKIVGYEGESIDELVQEVAKMKADLEKVQKANVAHSFELDYVRDMLGHGPSDGWS